MKRDLSFAQFRAACQREDFTCEGFMGYYKLGGEANNVAVSIFNAGKRRRDQLAYLRAQRKRVIAENVALAKARGA